MTTNRATNAKLSPGANSIERARPTRHKDDHGKPYGPYYLRWRICLPDGRVVAKRSQGATVSEVRARAKETADEMLARTVNSSWQPGSDLADYLDKVSGPAVENARLEDGSKRRYRVALGQLKARLKGHTIGTGTRFRVLEETLRSIAKDHGSESARQARTVVGRYVIQQLVRDELMTGNPLSGMGIDLSSDKPKAKRAERALTRKELNAAIDWLLAADPAEGVEKPARGRWSREDAVAKRRNAIDLALLQACSGLRVSEANALTWDVFDRSAEVAKSKTHKGRVVPLLFPDVIEHLAKRKALGGAYVIGAPTDGRKVWDRDNCRKATAVLYPQIGKAIKCPEVFDDGRTHLWRESLNSLMLHVPVEVRAAYFGHDKEVNRRYYTDTTDVSPMLKAAKKLR